MANKKKFLLRIDGNVHAALEKWAADELRSINAQIEYLLADALKKSGRMTSKSSSPPADRQGSSEDTSTTSNDN